MLVAGGHPAPEGAFLQDVAKRKPFRLHVQKIEVALFKEGVPFLVEDLEKGLVIADGIQAEGHDGPRQLSHIPPDSGQG